MPSQPLPPPKKMAKATLHKVFILDAQGGYAGEYAPDAECVVEYTEFLQAVPEHGLLDGQGLFMGEWRATLINGERMSLVALSKGPLGTEELTWARAALVAAEAQLTSPPSGDEAPPNAGPDKAVMESLSRAITEREEQLAARESELRATQGRAQAAVEETRKGLEAQIADLHGQLASARQQHELDVHALAAEREQLHRELEALARTPKPETAPVVAVDPRVEAMRKQLEQDRKYLQKYALDLVSREESVRDREMTVEGEATKLANTRRELEALRAEVQAAKAAPPPVEWEGEKRELETRIKILEQKALELLARDEKLREREKKLHEMLKSI